MRLPPDKIARTIATLALVITIAACTSGRQAESVQNQSSDQSEQASSPTPSDTSLSNTPERTTDIADASSSAEDDTTSTPNSDSARAANPEGTGPDSSVAGAPAAAQAQTISATPDQGPPGT